MTLNGALPYYLIIYSENTGLWHITDRHGNEAFFDLKVSIDTKLSLLDEAGATYQIIDSTKHIAQKKGKS